MHEHFYDLSGGWEESLLSFIKGYMTQVSSVTYEHRIGTVSRPNLKVTTLKTSRKIDTKRRDLQSLC